VVESVLQKLSTRQLHVDSIEELNPKLRLITLSGDALENVIWTLGDKMRIQLGGSLQRTYTPLDWVSEEGSFRFLVYLHADRPGTRWARSLRVDHTCAIGRRPYWHRYYPLRPRGHAAKRKCTAILRLRFARYLYDL
jgi:ferric-chelate reductase (NADPH)